MKFTKKDYILRSLKKVAHKRWEYFIISRVIHKLDDDHIEFVTQQLVRCKNGQRALTDLYFPQFNLHLEIDEPHHNGSVAADERREQDIVDETGHEMIRIRILDERGIERELPEVRVETDSFVERLRSEKNAQQKSGTFSPWDFEHRYDPKRIIAMGEFSVSDNVLFRTQVDAMRCFGFTGKGHQRGIWKVRDGSGDMLWFPRLYEHGMWRNELCKEGKVIYERAINEDGRASIRKQRKEFEENPNQNLIVFAKARDSLGFQLLRYVGTFRVNLADLSEDHLSFNRERVSETVRHPA